MKTWRGAARAGLVLPLLLAVSAVAQAVTSAEQGRALASVAQEVVQSEAFVVACAQKYPETSAANRSALAAWKTRNGLRSYDAVLASFGKRSPELLQKLADLRASYVALILKQPNAKLGPICSGLRGTLEQANSNTLRAEHASDLAVIDEIAQGLSGNANPEPTSGGTAQGGTAQGGTVQSGTVQSGTVQGGPGPEPGTPKPGGTQTGTLYTLPQLSGLMAGAYDSARTSSQKDGAVLAKLKALGTFAVHGVAGEHFWLEYGQGKMQSRYKVECAFPSSADASAFSKARGREVLISGRVKQFQSYFGAVLQDCTLLTSAAGLKRSSLPEQAGLKRKSLTAQEVMTRPGKGLQPSQIQGLYFYSKSEQRMDGFGNLYLNVDSRTYLVLKDGSAYRYPWGFPPEDFDVAASRREEPAAWGRWSSASYDGIEASEFDRLLPVPMGWKLKQSFSLTRVGQGGSLSERGLTLRADGRFSSVSTAALAGFTQGGGAVGETSTTTAGPAVTTSGPGGQTKVATVGSLKSAAGSYLAGGYTLTLRLPDGSVSRNLIGIPQSTSAASPEYIVYRGQMWFADEK